MEGQARVQAVARAAGAGVFRPNHDGRPAACAEGGDVAGNPLLAHLVGRGRRAERRGDGQPAGPAGVRRRRSDASSRG